MASMTINWAIGKVIDIAATAFDNWIHRVEKANEAMNEAVGEYESAKSNLENVNSELEEQNKKLDELLSKDKLTYAEKGQLEELQDITKELLLQQDIEEKRADKASKEAARKSVDAYQEQYGKYDKTEEQLNKKISLYVDSSNKDDVLGNISGYILWKKRLELSQTRYQTVLAEGADNISWYEDDIQYHVDMLADYSQILDDNISDLHEKRIAQEDEYNKVIAKRGSDLEPLSTSDKELIESYESICDLIRMIYEYTDPDTWKSMQIESIFNTEGIEKTKEELVEMVKAGEFDENTLQSYPKLSEALDQNKVSASELRNELEALAEAESNVKGDPPTMESSTSFEDAWAGSFTSENEAVKELGNDLLKLAAQGRLTTEVFDQADSEAGDYFKNLGISAEEAIVKVNRLVDESSQLSSMSDQFSKISEALGTKRDNNFVSAETLSDFDAEIRGSDSWDRFQELLGSTTSSYQECQEAANALATEWVNNSDFLAQLTAQNEEYYSTQLKSMGIENYEEIIAYARELNSAKESLSRASFDLTAATSEEIQTLIDEGTYSELAQQQIWALILAKQVTEGITLDSSADCQNLLALAQNAGVTGNAVSLLTRLMNIYNNLANGVYGTNSHAIEEAKKQAAELTNQINNILADQTSDTIKVSPAIKMDPAAKSSAKSAAESFTEALDKELAALDKNLDAGYIDFDDYIQARLALIDDYYKQGKLSADEYYSYLEKHYDTQLSYMDQAVNAVTRRIDTELDALKQQKEDVENFYKAQIDSLEKEKTLLEEANRERQRQKDLQKSIYDMERAKNQRTQLVYTEGRGMHYAADDQAVRDAQENVDNARYDIQIAGIEKSVSKLEAARDRVTGVIDEKISALEAYKNAWSDVTSAYAAEQEDLIAAQILGADWETNILNGRLDILDTFKNQYISIQQAMADAARESANEQIKAAKEAEKGASGTNHARKGLNLVGEDGAEAYFDNHGHVAIVTEPTLIPMEGGEVITPARPGSLMWDLREKFNAYINRASGGISSVMAPADSVQKDMARRLGSISTVNNITNTGMRQVTIGDIHVTCPGVTSQEVARQVGVELNKQFSGLSLAALQESKK